jgi:hypothetical protein
MKKSILLIAILSVSALVFVPITGTAPYISQHVGPGAGRCC